jgi:crotonobetainyl-CoA:carnitine CoA-transferase CaiB-like acyl-CoA transferase
LVRRADIITINASAKQLAPIGLGFEDLKRLNPRVILCHLDAFGGPTIGPHSNYPGYDDLVQATTGVMERFGGSLASVEEHAHFGTIDVLGGLCAALATALALLRRETTGKGDVARSSLAAAGQWLQSRFMYDYPDRPPFDEPRGPEAKGEGSYSRCYRASDGWFFLAARPDLAKAMSERLMEGSVGDPLELEASLAALFKSQPVAAWKERLRDMDVAVQPLNSLSATRVRSLADPGMGKTAQFLRDDNHPVGSAVEHIDPTAIRPSNAPILPLSAAPKYGSGTRGVLREVGYTEQEIADLLVAQVIAEKWSDDYLPN